MWIFIDSGDRNGLENMQLDEWLARSWFQETRQPVFRLYGWSPFALSLGFHQSINDVNVDALKQEGYDLVRRPTGGRAVFHAEEITYSIVLDATRLSVNDVYKRVSRALVAGLNSIGYDVTFAGTKQDFNTLYKDKKSVSCFTASGEYEIQYGGRKLVGSAQRRYAREDGGITALQHGSILTGKKHLQLVDFLRINDETKKRLKSKMEQSSTDLSDSGADRIDFSGIKSSIKETVLNYLANGEYEERPHSFFISGMRERAIITEYTL